MLTFDRKPPTRGGKAPAPAPPASQRAEIRHALTSPKLQARLTVNQPGDEYEREADRVADEVTRGHASGISASSPPAVQRACSCGGTCDKCKEKDEELRRSPEAGAPAPSEAPASVHETLRSPGRPLERGIRERLEPRFGVDFGGVRIHTDSPSARDVAARAYTVGNDVVFAPGQYAPGTLSGDHLLAHELTHVVQQVRHLARKDEKLTCGSGFPEGYASLGPWVANQPRPTGIGEKAYYITGTWKETDDKDSFFLRTVDAWIRWRFGSVSGAVREQIHKILPVESNQWFKGVTLADHQPGCQYRIYTAPSTHDAISLLVKRDRAAREAEKREEEAGLGGDGGGADVTGGVEPPEGATPPGPGDKGFKPSGSEYVTDGPTSGKATATAFPAKILGPDFQADEGVGYYTMQLDYRIVGDNISQLIEGFNYVDYHWERYDITPLVEKGVKAETEKAYRKTAQSQAAEVGSFEGTAGRAKHSVKKLGRDAATAAGDVLHPVDSAYTGTATEVLGNLYANKLNLQLLPASAIVSLGGTALGALADLIGGKAQEREMTWPKEGYYLIRCIARPAAQTTRTRAASVATKVVEVRKPEKLAKAGLDEADAAVAKAEFEVAAAQTPEEKARKTTELEQQKINASGSALQILQQRRDSLKEEQKKATGYTAEKLKDQLEKLEAQILRLQEQLYDDDVEGEILRPRLSLASEITGQTYPLLVTLLPLKREKDGPYRYSLIDVTGKGVEDFGGAGKTPSEAAWKAIRHFAEKNGYGEGRLAVRFLNPGKTRIDPAQQIIPNVKHHDAQTRERLNDLVTALVTLGLFVPGVGEVAAVLGAVIAADRLYHRWSTGTLEPDGEAIADVLGVIGALGMGASVLGKLKVVRGEKAFALALKEADEAGLQAALKVIERGSETLETINKANELIGHAGMVVGNVNLFDQFIKIQHDELNGTLNHAEARRMRFEMLLGALRDNAVPLHLIRGEKPAAKAKAEEVPGKKALPETGGVHEKAPAVEKPAEAPGQLEKGGSIEKGGNTVDPSALKPGDPQTVQIGAGLSGKEKVAAQTTTRDGLHNVIILEDGRIIRCSRSCGDILAHYETFLKEETDAGRKEKAAAWKTKLQTLESQSKATKDPAEREQIAKDAAAIDQELRTFAAERLQGELKTKGGGVESLLSFLKPEEVRALRAELGEKLFNYLSSRKNPNIARKFVEALEMAPNATERALAVSALELGARVGEKQLLKDLNYLTERPEPKKKGEVESVEHAEDVAREEVAKEKEKRRRRTPDEIAAENAAKEARKKERAEKKQQKLDKEARTADEKAAKAEAEKKAAEERATRDAARVIAEAENKKDLETKKAGLDAKRAKLQAELDDIRRRTREANDAIADADRDMRRLVDDERRVTDPDASQKLRDQAVEARKRKEAAQEAESRIPSPDETQSKLAKINAELAHTELALEVASDPKHRGRLPCFAAGTPVWTPGGARPIERLREGDTVLAWDFNSRMAVERKVTGVLRNRTLHFYDVVLGDQTVRATGLHRFWVEDRGDWIEARHLVPGMRCRRPDGGSAEIASSVRSEGFDEETWNLTVEELSNYFVGPGVLVHNAGGGQGYDLGFKGPLLIYRGTNPKFPDLVYIGQSDSIDREGEHRSKAKRELKNPNLSAADRRFYTFMSEVDLVVIVSGINKDQADYLEQRNIEIERKIKQDSSKDLRDVKNKVLNRRNQITDESHLEAVVKRILADPAVKKEGYCPG